ncbi:hypothetical protein [Endozoicomonas ascidiicola]|uniref:hypothetical protein n=1 Tax=Endozoicomonas ascidiicola TaxID=1698521 RepID=UPI00082CD4AF|nr:hypothetical protein [Endozoicomonas ascidiicola]
MASVELKEVMVDVRQAQRLMVAFYKRVMPLIKDISVELDCEHFHYWSPERFNRPSKSTNNPLQGRWEWDMVPMADTYFIFTSKPLENKDAVRKNTWMLVVRLVTDSGTEAFNGNHRNWNPLKFKAVEQCETRLELYGYQSQQDTTKDWGYWDLWHKSDYPKLNGQLTTLGDKGAVFGCSVNLEDISSTDSLPSVLSEFKQRLAEYHFAGE